MNWHIYQITIFGHKFVLKIDRLATEADLSGWFDDIMEALRSFGIKI